MAVPFEECNLNEKLDIAESLDRWRRFGSEQAGRVVMKYCFSLYGESLLGYLCKICAEINDAEDIRQDAFIRFFQCLKESNFTVGKGERTYLFTIAHNLAMDKWRKKKTSVATEDGAIDIPDKGQNPETIVIKTEDKKNIESAISKLPENLRRVVKLRYYDNMALKEIAAKLSVSSPTTIFNRLEQAIKKLHEILTKKGDTP